MLSAVEPVTGRTAADGAVFDSAAAGEALTSAALVGEIGASDRTKTAVVLVGESVVTKDAVVFVDASDVSAAPGPDIVAPAGDGGAGATVVVVVVVGAAVAAVVAVVVVPHGGWLITKLPNPVMSVPAGNVIVADVIVKLPVWLTVLLRKCAV